MGRHVPTYAKANPDLVEIALSPQEKNALVINPDRPALHRVATAAKRETLHIHEGVDWSMHCLLSPSALSLLPESSGCQRTDRFTITASSSSAAIPILCNGLRVADMSAAESVTNIRTLVHSQHHIAIARSLRGREAQGLIDFIDQVCHTRLWCYDTTWP